MDSDEKHKCFKLSDSRIGSKKVTQEASSNPKASKMIKIAASLLLSLHLIIQLTSASMSLPGGIENILGFVPKSNFRCERDGYFGDIDNDCRIFHLCQKNVLSNGRTEWRHWTYACGNQTMFNQLTLTCAFVDEAIPCRHASQFQYLNEVIHKPKEPFLTDADVTSGISYYSNRVMSDGARARAFEDSNLMAQIGGQTVAANSFASQPASAFIEDDLSSSRTINSIETPVMEEIRPVVSQRASSWQQARLQQPRQQQHFRQVRLPQQQQQFQPLALPRSNSNAEFIINHHHHFQHTNHPLMAVQSQQQQQLPSPEQFRQFQPQPAREQPPRAINQPAETIQNKVLAQANSQPQQDNLQILVHQQHQQQPSQQQQRAPAQTETIDNTPRSFGFSITTDHHQGPAESSQLINPPAPSSDPSSFTFPPLLNQQQQFAPNSLAQSQQQQSFQTTTISPPPQQFSTAQSQTLQPPTSTFPSPAAGGLPPNFDPLLAARPTVFKTEAPANTTVTVPTPTFVSTSTQPATEPATPATTSSTTGTTTLSSQAIQHVAALPSIVTVQEPPRRPEQSSRFNKLTLRQQRNFQNDLIFGRPFQSTRISSQSTESRNKRSESALVMRKQNPVVVSIAESSRVETASPSEEMKPVTEVRQPSSSELKTALTKAAVFDSANFWRQPFDMLFVAPKFDQLLMRRRV